MRKFAIAALLLISCGPGSRDSLPDREELAAGAPRGVDLLAIRVPRTGGRARVYNYPALDSVKWSSVGSVPSMTRVLAFDSEAGTLLYADSRSIARALDFRLSAVSPASQLRLSSLNTADAWNVYGISQKGDVGRSTPAAMLQGSSAGSAVWSFAPEKTVREVFALPSGAVVVIGADSTSTTLWKLFPPDKDVVDSLVLGRTAAAFRTSTGDRIYLSEGSKLIGLAVRDFSVVLELSLRRPAREVIATPSGNQLFVVGDSSDRVAVVDRYQERVTEQIRFPAAVRTVRIDPLGRFLLAAPFEGDSAWIVPLSNLRLVRSVATEWFVDLPHIAWDGTVVLARARDVHMLDPVTLDSIRTIKGGAADFWHFFTWNGFRPPEPGSQEPIVFASGPARVDTSEFIPGRRNVLTIAESTAAARRVDSARRADEDRDRTKVTGIFTVSFAVLRDETNAGELARSITVGGQRARVVAAMVDATAIFRVVLGPYPSREEAEAVGRRSGKSYWVYEGPP